MRVPVPTLTLPPKARTWAYLVYGLLSLAVVLSQAGFAALEQPFPDWLVVGLATVPILGVAIGATAATHVPAAPDAQAEEVVELTAHRYEPGREDA